MNDLTVTKRAAANVSLPTLLEFHSPSAALSHVQALPGARGTMWVTVSLVAACFAAAALIPIDKVVTAGGKVVALTATTVVQPLETAIVRSVDVREGQVVQKGDVLARLDPTFAIADLSALQSQVTSLDAEVGRLQAEAEGKPYRPADASAIAVLQGAIFSQRQGERGFKNENYTQKISSLQSQVQRALTDRTGFSQKLVVLKDVQAKRAELAKLQVGSQLALLEAQAQVIEAQRGLDSANAQVMQTARDLQALQAERDGYNQQWRGQVSQELSEQGRKLSDAREQLNKATLRRSLVTLVADQPSIVQTIAKVSPGAVLQSGEQLMSLTPLDATLETEVNVAGLDAGFVHPGNPVTIKFDTFPFTQYGSAMGTVRFMSPDSFTSAPEDRQRGVSQNAAPQGGPAFYRSRITIDANNLHNTPPGFRVGPGMPVTADIKVGERTLMSYLLSRVLPVAMDGMREP